jgi:hypothetical protein
MGILKYELYSQTLVWSVYQAFQSIAFGIALVPNSDDILLAMGHDWIGTPNKIAII